MCGYKKIKIEYIMMAVAFASVVWSIFAGFRISRFQWLFVMGSVVWFLGMCRLLDQNKRNIVVMVVICIIYCMLAHRQLINGFQIINNKMAEALNQSMDLGFYYYISVTLEHSRRDSVLAVLFFVLVAGIVFGAVVSTVARMCKMSSIDFVSYNRSYGNGRFNDRAIWNFSSVFLVFRFMDCLF